MYTSGRSVGQRTMATRDIVYVRSAACSLLHMLTAYMHCFGQYATAVSICAALTYWYKHVRKTEDTSEWRIDPVTGEWCVAIILICIFALLTVLRISFFSFGLLTHSQVVAKYMIGLEKTKAKAGELQQSVKVITVDMMRQLYMVCIGDKKLTGTQQHQEIMRYMSSPASLTMSMLAVALTGQNAYLIAFLMMLCAEEVMSLRFQFENLNHISKQKAHFDVTLPPWKALQTGTCGRWRLWANDQNTFLCPKRAQMLLADVYRAGFVRTGPVFQHVDASGAVLQNMPMVRTSCSHICMHMC